MLTAHPRAAGLHQVAEAAQGDDARTGLAEMPAQARHVDLDGVGRDLLVEAEHLRGQAFLGDDAADPGHQRFEDRDLALAQGQDPAGEGRDLAGAVVDQVGAGQDRVGLAASAPDEGAHPRLELGRVERLGEVVVGAEIEARDPVGHRRPRRQDHRPGRRCRPGGSRAARRSRSGRAGRDRARPGRRLPGAARAAPRRRAAAWSTAKPLRRRAETIPRASAASSSTMRIRMDAPTSPTAATTAMNYVSRRGAGRVRMMQAPVVTLTVDRCATRRTIAREHTMNKRLALSLALSILGLVAEAQAQTTVPCRLSGRLCRV